MLQTPELTEAVAYKATVDERIAELWRWRQWCRRQTNSAHWSPLRIEYETELRALVKVARKARGVALPAIERADPLTAYEGWTEAEKAYTR